MTDNGAPFPPPTGAPAGLEATAAPWWKRWYVLAIPVVALLIVIGVIATAGGGDGDDDTAAGTTIAPTTTVASSTPAAPETTVAPSETTVSDSAAASTTSPGAATTAPAPTTQPPDPATPTCGYVGVDDFGDMQVELVLVNPLGVVPSLEVTFALTDSDGVRFFTGNEFVQLPLPNERFRIEADTITEPPTGVDESTITCAVLAIEEGFGEVLEMPGPEDFCEFVEIDDFGDIQVELGVTSPFATTEDLVIEFALRGPDDIRFADSTAFVDLVGPGEVVRLDQDTVTPPPTWVGDEISCGILGIAAG